MKSRYKFILLLPLCAGFFLRVSQLPQKSLCLFKLLTGFDCPGCGLTRAFLLILRLEIFSALELNWGSLGLYLFFVFLLFQNGVARFKKLNLLLFSASFLLMLGGWVYKLGTGIH